MRLEVSNESITILHHAVSTVHCIREEDLHQDFSPKTAKKMDFEGPLCCSDYQTPPEERAAIISCSTVYCTQ